MLLKTIILEFIILLCYKDFGLQLVQIAIIPIRYLLSLGTFYGRHTRYCYPDRSYRWSLEG